MIRYFVVETANLTNDILEKSINENNPFLLRTSLLRDKVIIKCACEYVSVDLFKAYAMPMTQEETIAYINNPENGFISDEV